MGFTILQNVYSKKNVRCKTKTTQENTFAKPDKCFPATSLAPLVATPNNRQKCNAAGLFNAQQML